MGPSDAVVEDVVVEAAPEEAGLRGFTRR